MSPTSRNRTLADAWRAVLEHVCAGPSHVDLTCRSIYAKALMAGKDFEDWFDDVSGRPANENRPPEWAISIIRGAKTGAVPLDDVIGAIEHEKSRWKDLGIGRVVRQALGSVRDRVTLGTQSTDAHENDENRQLREMLATCFAGPSLYTDDGELHDTSRWPPIDFRRDPVDEIKRKMAERARNYLAEKRP